MTPQELYDSIVTCLGLSAQYCRKAKKEAYKLWEACEAGATPPVGPKFEIPANLPPRSPLGRWLQNLNTRYIDQ